MRPPETPTSRTGEETVVESEVNDGRALIVPTTTDVQAGDDELALLTKIATLLTP